MEKMEKKKYRNYFFMPGLNTKYAPAPRAPMTTTNITTGNRPPKPPDEIRAAGVGKSNCVKGIAGAL